MWIETGDTLEVSQEGIKQETFIEKQT